MDHRFKVNDKKNNQSLNSFGKNKNENMPNKQWRFGKFMKILGLHYCTIAEAFYC